MKKVLLIILATVLAAVIFTAALVFVLSQTPTAIIFQDYPDKQCIVVEIVNEEDKLEKISCSEFEQTEDYKKGEYTTQWGGRPFD